MVCRESLDFEMGMIFLVFVSLEFLFVLVFNWFLGSGLFRFGCFRLKETKFVLPSEELFCIYLVLCRPQNHEAKGAEEKA